MGKRVLLAGLGMQDTAVLYDLADCADVVSITVVDRLILDGKVDKKGLLTPLDVPYEAVFPPLEKRNIRVQRLQAQAEVPGLRADPHVLKD